MSPQLDAEQLAHLRAREPAALARAVEEHARPLYRAARGMGFHEAEAEDLVQDVFTVFLETLDRFEGRARVRTWLFGILHRKALERRRAQFREEQNDSIDEVFESRFDRRGNWLRPPEDLQRQLESQQIGAALAHCLDRLPATQREVFVLREMEDLDSAEICKILDITVTNMGVLMHRARNRLRECIEAKGWSRK